MTQAIFLSCASQDADAAHRVCEALRAAGLEVWFDQSELRGGDAWDASIRKQIKECALFVPIISTNTNAREEGYFRLEWKLAVDRSHLMADHKAFLLPVVLDEVDETTAHVPDKFRERQWSRLHDAILLRARYKLYLDGDLAGTKALMDRLSDRYRGTDRAVFGQVDYALMSGNPEIGLNALGATPDPWMDDFHYAGPTQLLAGELLLLQGKTELARQRFEAAQAELVRRKLEPSRGQLRLWLESWLHMRLGRKQEARMGNALLVQELARPYRVHLDAGVVPGTIRLYLLLGERANALAMVREAVEDKMGRAILRTTIRLDPRIARFRNDAEILALLAEPDAQK